MLLPKHGCVSTPLFDYVHGMQWWELLKDLYVTEKKKANSDAQKQSE